ncbi:MAG TPA: NAD(P)H-binding protein [Bryobacteraceae bacterium]|nr:NAD(P)H-binding protein [Bryobacteraceae bacterium]
MARVLIAGASGFLGRRLSAELLRRGHTVLAVVRRGSEARAARGAEIVAADPFDPASYVTRLAGYDTYVHLIGVPHPSPAKAAQFRSVDLASAKVAVEAARRAGIGHFVYVSVAHPAPVMREYIAARMEAEALIRAAGLNATILRPWYVLGPGRRWPVILMPVYWLLGAIPATRDGARRLGLVTVEQMVAAMAAAIEQPTAGVRVLEVPQIRAARLLSA